MWTKEAIHEFVETRLQGHPLIVVATREPYIHRFAGLSALELWNPGQHWPPFCLALQVDDESLEGGGE